MLFCLVLIFYHLNLFQKILSDPSVETDAIKRIICVKLSCLNVISILSSGGHFVQWRGTTCAIWEKGIMMNICVILFFNWG